MLASKTQPPPTPKQKAYPQSLTEDESFERKSSFTKLYLLFAFEFSMIFESSRLLVLPHNFFFLISSHEAESEA